MTVALAAVLVLGTAACTSGGPDNGSAASSNGRASGLLGALQHVRDNPQDRSSTQAYCLLTVTQSDNDIPMNAFLAGLFDVAADQSLRTFCDAIVEAVIAQELTDEDLALFSKPRSERGLAPLGVLLRKLLDAHERLKSLQVRDPGAAGPATASS